MAAVGAAEVTGSCFLWSGVVSFFVVLLLLSIFLTALCSDCRRRSFELRDSGVNRYPSSLIRVVKLEDAVGGRENPTINDMKNDEKESVPAWRSHLGAPQDQRVAHTNGSAVTKASSGPEPAAEEDSVQIPPWRSHLGAPQSRDPDSAHIYHVIGGGRSSNGDANASSPPANQEPGQERGSGVVLSDHERNSLYARVSKKAKLTTPPVDTPEQVQVEAQVEEEEVSPPLPDRLSQLDG
ncbi:hypothetical protein D5F01_LYC24284 [Larimichthys crocea]|uniref:Uncharacterized protein n=2 Tax=Larimichthys crocea TaxID=215358 RepID=A0A6G0HEP6_LARCR|nr:uncharacterized protein LOC104938417 isoform X2 [Larimichthys crocea]KAE8277708.1 hypothetical protein D5F01_LYC24284 [Larimichthys crocea]